jgi:formate dehydrogenase subunit gamma
MGQAPSRSAFDLKRAEAIIDGMKHLDGALLPILHALQAEFGYVDEAILPIAAKALNLSKAEVHGTLSFYHDFRTVPAGHHQIAICRAEACQSVGCERLVGHLEHAHGLRIGETRADGLLTVLEVFCLGNCALGPAILADGEPIGRVDEDMLDALVARAGSPRPLADPQSQS